jgi:hypothetical protein
MTPLLSNFLSNQFSMNIVVIGSCADSSHLAKELNKRLNNSIVARIDLLKNIKQLTLQNANVRQTPDVLGTYIGDVEEYDYARIPETTKANIIEAMKTIDESVKRVTGNALQQNGFLTSTFDALTSGLPSSTYSFIKVYSGAIDDYRISKMQRDQNFVSNSIFIVVRSPKDLLLPITVSSDMLQGLKKEAFSFIEIPTIEEVFTSEVFQLLFEINNEPQKEIPADNNAGQTTAGGLGLAAQILNNPNPGIVQEIFAMAA